MRKTTHTHHTAKPIFISFHFRQFSTIFWLKHIQIGSIRWTRHSSHWRNVRGQSQANRRFDRCKSSSCIASTEWWTSSWTWTSIPSQMVGWWNDTTNAKISKEIWTGDGWCNKTSSSSSTPAKNNDIGITVGHNRCERFIRAGICTQVIPVLINVENGIHCHHRISMGDA